MAEKSVDLDFFQDRKITYKGASYAGIAQSVSQASQNSVDLVRHECTIKLTAMGKAYQKLLANPSENNETYKEIIEESMDIHENLKDLGKVLYYYTNTLCSDDQSINIASPENVQAVDDAT